MSPLTQGLNYRSACDDNIINIQKYRYISAVYLISYIQHSDGTNTAFHRTYSCHSFFLSVSFPYPLLVFYSRSPVDWVRIYCPEKKSFKFHTGFDAFRKFSLKNSGPNGNCGHNLLVEINDEFGKLAIKIG